MSVIFGLWPYVACLMTGFLGGLTLALSIGYFLTRDDPPDINELAEKLVAQMMVEDEQRKRHTPEEQP